MFRRCYIFWKKHLGTNGQTILLFSVVSRPPSAQPQIPKNFPTNPRKIPKKSSKNPQQIPKKSPIPKKYQNILDHQNMFNKSPILKKSINLFQHTFNPPQKCKHEHNLLKTIMLRLTNNARQYQFL